MRRLHPPNRGDRKVDQGTYLRAGGRQERFTVHEDVAGRRTVRVEVLPEGDLWQLALSPEGRPERIELRWREGEQRFEAALTCFEDEVLFWRRGAEPISESLVMPPGYRLLWPPIAGRAESLAGLETELDARGRAATMFLLLRRRPLARGGLRGRPAKLGIRLSAAAMADDPPALQSGPTRRIVLESPGLPLMQAELDLSGRLLHWLEDGEVIAERQVNPESEGPPLGAAPTDTKQGS